MINFVVECFSNLLFPRATIVHKLPIVPTMLNIESIIATKYAVPLDTMMISILNTKTILTQEKGIQYLVLRQSGFRLK